MGATLIQLLRWPTSLPGLRWMPSTTLLLVYGVRTYFAVLVALIVSEILKVRCPGVFFLFLVSCLLFVLYLSLRVRVAAVDLCTGETCSTKL